MITYDIMDSLTEENPAPVSNSEMSTGTVGSKTRTGLGRSGC